MKSFRKELTFNVPSRRGFINITPEVTRCLQESGIREGLVLVNAKQNYLQEVHQYYHRRRMQQSDLKSP